MVLRLVKRDPCWLELHGAPYAIEAEVRAQVKPATRRSYDRSTGLWSIHWQWIKWLVDLARSKNIAVIWADLPATWQKLAAGATMAVDEVSAEPVCVYATLYLTNDAPLEVVKAAYKALAAKTHPDVGGDERDFRRISDAYKNIIKTFETS